MGGDTLKISILNRQELKNCDPNKRIVVQLRLDNPPDGYYFFKWTSLGVMTTTESRTVLLAFPSWYCGTEIEVKVVAVKNRFAPSDNFVLFNPIQIKNDNPSDKPPPLRNDINEASIKFTPTCSLQLLKIDWFDRENKLIGENDPIRSNRYYLIDVNIAGMNNERLTGNFVSDYHVVPISVTVVDSHAYIPFFADIKFLREKKSDKDPRETEINLNLFRNSRDLRSNRQVINGISKKIMLANSTFNLVEPITSFPLQPVVVGTIDIVENNFLPCKYTKIEVNTTPKNRNNKAVSGIVFDEMRSIKVKPINLIGGKNSIKISIHEYETTQCKLQKNSHKKNNKAILTKYHEEPQQMTIPKDGSLDFDILYKYPSNLSSRVASFVKMMFASRERVVQPQSLLIETCRHRKEVVVNLYPDTEFSATLSIGQQALTHTSSSMPDAHGIYKKHMDKAIEAEWYKEFNISDLKVGFSLGCEYDDNRKIELTSSYEKTVESITGVMGAIKESLDLVSGKSSIASGNIDKCTPSLLRAPVFLEISNPKVIIGGSWKLEPDSNQQIIRTGKIELGFKPLVKAEGGIDMIVAASYIPGAGQVITLIEKANNLIGKLVRWISKERLVYESDIMFNIYGYGEVNIMGLMDIGEETETELNAEGSVGLGIEIGINVKLEATIISLFGSRGSESKIGAELGLKGEAEASLSISASKGINFDNGPYLKLEAKFNGVTVMVTGNAGVNYDRGDNESTYGIDFDNTVTFWNDVSPLEKQIFLFNAENSEKST